MNEDRPIEKLLRRYAKKRRDDAGSPVELHPATRRLLQGEVGRLFPKGAPGYPPTTLAAMFKRWRSQLAWAVPLFVMIAFGLWKVLDRQETKQLALGPTREQTAAADGTRASTVERQEPDARSSTLDVRRSAAGETAPVEFSAVKGVPPSPASAPIRSLNQPTPGLADQDVVGKSQVANQLLAFATATNQPFASLAGAAEPKVDSARAGYKITVPADKLGIAPAAAPSRAQLAESSSANQPKLNETAARSFDAQTSQTFAPLPAKPVPAATFARNDSLERDQAQTYSQSFANLAPEALKQKTAKAIAATPISPVLANFRVEQTGRQLRVVDSDGSTYVGETDASPEFWGTVGGKQEQAVSLFKSDGKLNPLPTAAKSVPESQLQNNLYRVAGTNRTLNQTVVFTWSFQDRTNAPLTVGSGKIGDELNRDAKKMPAQFPAQLQNSFITGRAQFGAGKEIEINAVPVGP
jgi:hypothetical protein